MTNQIKTLAQQRKQQPIKHRERSPQTRPAERRICEMATQPRIVVPTSEIVPNSADRIPNSQNVSHHVASGRWIPNNAHMTKGTPKITKNCGADAAPKIATGERRAHPTADASSAFLPLTTGKGVVTIVSTRVFSSLAC